MANNFVSHLCAPREREHQWYNSDDVVDRCYHCTVGIRQHVDPDPAHQEILEDTTCNLGTALLKEAQILTAKLTAIQSDVGARQQTSADPSP